MSADHLDDTVISGGFCVGCGVCSVLPDVGIRMAYTAIGTFRADIDAGHRNASLDPESVCPFSGQSVDEDSLGKDLFPEAASHSEIGRHLATYAGAVSQGSYRARGSSGGMVTWLATQFLREGLVDAVAHVKERVPTSTDSRLFEFAFSHSADEVARGAKSRYYPVEMSKVLREIAERPGRYLVIGLPCFIKAIRLLQRQDSRFRQRIPFTIGLVCGHLKSASFAEFLSWQVGVPPNTLEGIDFRYKLQDRPANTYGIKVWSHGGKAPIIAEKNKLLGSNWGLGLFKYRACEFCDDVLAETADVAIGDAWLPRYVQDSRGTNIVVVRNPTVQRILSEGTASGALVLDAISADDVAASQASGLRHRREGLEFRLNKGRRDGLWHPPKRVSPSNPNLDQSREKVYSLREEMSVRSHSVFLEAKKRGDVDYVEHALEPWLQAYSMTYNSGGILRSLRRLTHRIPRSLRRLARGFSVRLRSSSL